MQAALWRELTLCGVSLIPIVGVALMAALYFNLPVLILLLSSLSGAVTVFIVQTVFIVSAYGFSSKFLSAAVVIYRALYAYIMKYAVMIMIFFGALHWDLLHHLTFILSFCAVLILRVFASLWHPSHP